MYICIYIYIEKVIFKTEEICSGKIRILFIFKYSY